jgi:hypothetical protein
METGNEDIKSGKTAPRKGLTGPCLVLTQSKEDLSVGLNEKPESPARLHSWRGWGLLCSFLTIFLFSPIGPRIRMKLSIRVRKDIPDLNITCAVKTATSMFACPETHYLDACS